MSGKKVGERGWRGASKEQKWRKGKDAGCRSLCVAQSLSILFISVHGSVCRCTQRTFSKTPGLCRSVTFHLLHQHPRLCFPATLPVTGSAPPLLDEKTGVPGRASCLGEAVGLTLTPPPPSSRAPNPPGSQIKPYAGRQPAAGSATSCRSRRPRPISLLDGLSVAVSLAFLSKLVAAAAGFAAVASFPGAAGLAAVLQRGAGVSPLQTVFFQELQLEHR